MTRIAVLVLAAALLAATGAQAQLRLLPPDPRASEPFVLQTFGSAGSNTVEVVNTRVDLVGQIVLNVQTSTLLTETSKTWVSVVIPGLGTGSYQVLLRTNQIGFDIGRGFANVGAAVATPAPQFRGATGNFFNAAESGWGVNIIEGVGGNLFVVWFDHGNPLNGAAATAAKAMWMVLPGGRWITPTTFRGILYDTEARGLNQDYGNLHATPRGYASLTFLSADEVDFTATVGFGPEFREVSKTKRLRRQVF